MSATLKDVALKAGVSTSAVSRTFTPGASVSTKMRTRVEKAAEELGYQPNFLARSLTTRRTKLIGLVSDNFTNPFFLHVFDLFTSGLQEQGLRPLLVNISGQHDPVETAQMLRQYSVDGVIVASSTVGRDFVDAFQNVKIPIVYTFSRYYSSPEVNIVGIDNRAAGEYAANILIDRGYETIGFMGGPKEAISTYDRYLGFSKVMSEHPEIDFSYSFAEAYSFAAGRKEMMRLLEGDKAEAYFGADDVVSIGALSAIEAHGLSVPDDIGILGLNDIEMAGWENINLTTIRQPVAQIVASSIELMASLLEREGEQYPEARLLPSRLVERGTLRPPSDI
ncbi:LacI family DNA-binding transcriptional regulator [Cochlodiniinecator piscidefendens]|uniref:LacI family DNA-binding transcriptional regulator n=1 Tax=Cochlodiniinecator piscidefendens TaxID=2715756 RepID=UPI00140C7FCE|nr:LacI family DNA-binding transcriptional regulator [Cochlodiniinecator piscidefendens]